MLEKVSQMAEQVATRASRREFLGRFGGGAMTVAAAIGGVLAFPAGAIAGKKCTSNADCTPGQVCYGGHCAAVCDGYSYTSCINDPVGSPCSGGLGLTGRCKPIEKKATTCGCY